MLKSKTGYRRAASVQHALALSSLLSRRALWYCCHTTIAASVLGVPGGVLSLFEARTGEMDRSGATTTRIRVAAFM
jgi:hypothetical protein